MKKDINNKNSPKSERIKDILLFSRPARRPVMLPNLSPIVVVRLFYESLSAKPFKDVLKEII